VAALIDDCVICGDDHPRCARHNSRGGPCMRWPRDEEKLCRLHGGESPASVSAGIRRRALKAVQADAQALLGYELDGKVSDPLAVVEGMVASEIAMMQGLAARLNDLSQVSYGSAIGTEQIRGVALLYERSRDRVVKYVEVLMKHKPDGEAVATANLLTSLSDKLAGHK
jgi:hypothetical protein